MRKQIIALNNTSDKILFRVFNNVNQLFQILPNKFQEITDNLGIEVSTEELGGGTKYGMGYTPLGNEEYPTHDYLMFWEDMEHKEYYIYIYRETEDVYALASILDNVYIALMGSFNALMEHGKQLTTQEEIENQDRHCESCVCDDKNYCEECRGFGSCKKHPL